MLGSASKSAPASTSASASADVDAGADFDADAVDIERWTVLTKDRIQFKLVLFFCPAFVFTTLSYWRRL